MDNLLIHQDLVSFECCLRFVLLIIANRSEFCSPFAPGHKAASVCSQNIHERRSDRNGNAVPFDTILVESCPSVLGMRALSTANRERRRNGQSPTGRAEPK